MTDDAVVEVFAEVACPFTHVALRRLMGVLGDGAPARVRIRAWPLEWVNGRPLDPAHVADEVDALRSQVAPELFAGFEPGRLPRTSIPAFGLVAAAARRGAAAGTTVGLRLRTAVFEEGRDVADPSVLAELAAEAGVELPDTHAAEAAVRADYAEGRARGVAGSPHFFVGDRNWFCPLLHIDKTDDGFRIEPNPQGAAELLAAVQRATPH